MLTMTSQCTPRHHRLIHIAAVGPSSSFTWGRNKPGTAHHALPTYNYDCREPLPGSLGWRFLELSPDRTLPCLSDSYPVSFFCNQCRIVHTGGYTAASHSRRSAWYAEVLRRVQAVVWGMRRSLLEETIASFEHIEPPSDTIEASREWGFPLLEYLQGDPNAGIKNLQGLQGSLGEMIGLW
jgi:hypothetical protein